VTYCQIVVGIFFDRFPLHSKNILKENATTEEVLLEYSLMIKEEKP